MVVQDEEILSAIDRIIKDVDRKYDECLVEQFVNTLSIHGRLDSDRSSLILDRLKFYFEHKSFLMLNQTRAFKILASISKRMRNKQELEKLMPFLDTFWKSVDTVILNNNTSAMAIMFDVLNVIVSVDELGIVWVLEREITPPIQMSIPIDGIPSLVKYYITTVKNYHTKNRAEKLVQKLIISNSPHPSMAKIEKLVRDLILDGQSVGLIIRAIYARPHLPLHSRYNINETIKDSFMANVEKTSTDLNNICKHLSLTDISRKFIIEKLRSKKRLDCIIYYITESKFSDNLFEQLLLSYVLYPLLAKSNDEETQALVSSLMATRDEKDFVEWNMNSKTQILCLVQLKNIFQLTVDSGLRCPFTDRTANMIVATLSNYIRCHYSLECTGSQVKNMLECCCIFELITQVYGFVEARVIRKILRIMQNLLEDIRYNDLTKPVVIQYIKTMLLASRTILMEEYIEPGVVSGTWLKAVDLAFKFEDSELLNEFTEFFIHNCPRGHVGQEIYIKLVFDHILSKTKDTDHRELLGNLIKMLIMIDLHAGDLVLEKQNIKRFHDIPIIISDIICQKSVVPTTIEKVFDLGPNLTETENTITERYLDKLSSPEVREKLARALVLIVKSDSREFTRKMSIRRLKRTVFLFIRDDLRLEKALVQLVSTGILKTLYEVLTEGLYSEAYFEEVTGAIKYIKATVISKVDNLSEILVDQDLLSFYMTDEEYNYDEIYFKNLRYSEDRVDPLSCVKDILSESSERGILECY